METLSSSRLYTSVTGVVLEGAGVLGVDDMVAQQFLALSKQIEYRDVAKESCWWIEMKLTAIEQTAQSPKGHRKMEISTTTKSTAQDSRHIARTGSLVEGYPLSCGQKPRGGLSLSELDVSVRPVEYSSPGA